MKKSILTTFFLAISIIITAQNQFITLKNDTLNCRIDSIGNAAIHFTFSIGEANLKNEIAI